MTASPFAQLSAAAITEAQKASRCLQVAAFADSIDTMGRRLDALERRRLEDTRRKAKADAEEEEQRVQDYLDSLPNPDEPNEPAIYPSSGHLHAVSPTNHGTATDQGDLPKELQKGAPPQLGTDPELDPTELAHPQRPKYEQPVSVSLASEDDY